MKQDNPTCFPYPPGCCMYRLPYEQVGPDIKGSRWVVFLLSVSWNWHPHTASGQLVLILFISHSPGDRYRQCLWYGQSKIRQTSSGRVVWYCVYCIYSYVFAQSYFHPIQIWNWYPEFWFRTLSNFVTLSFTYLYNSISPVLNSRAKSHQVDFGCGVFTECVWIIQAFTKCTVKST